MTKRRRGQAWWAAASWKASAKWNTAPFFFFTLGRKHCEGSIHRHSEESLCQQVSCRIICYNEGCLVMRVGSLGFYEQVNIVHISVFTPYYQNASESSDQHGTMLRRLKHIMHCCDLLWTKGFRHFSSYLWKPNICEYFDSRCIIQTPEQCTGKFFFKKKKLCPFFIFSHKLKS